MSVTGFERTGECDVGMVDIRTMPYLPPTTHYSFQCCDCGLFFVHADFPTIMLAGWWHLEASCPDYHRGGRPADFVDRWAQLARERIFPVAEQQTTGI